MGITETVIVGLIVFFLFSAKRLPDIWKGIGGGGGSTPPTAPPPAPSGEQFEGRRGSWL